MPSSPSSRRRYQRRSVREQRKDGRGTSLRPSRAPLDSVPTSSNNFRFGVLFLLYRIYMDSGVGSYVLHCVYTAAES